MAKMIVTEETLNRIIQECITEALEDEGVGNWLGNAYQWARNKWNNFKGDFNAGRNHQRYLNKDYDPYHYYDNADDFRNFGGQEYGAYRYNQTVDRNNAAKQWTADKKKPQTNPELGGEGNVKTEPNTAPPQQSPQQPPQQQQATQQPPQQQRKGGFQPKQARPIANIQAQVTNGRVMSKADGQLVAAALGEYKKNHPEVNEDVIRRAVNESFKKFLNEIDETKKARK